MLFKPEHIDLIIAWRKTQTRRVCKPGEKVNSVGLVRMVETAQGRVKWRVGDDYAVQPGRGKPGAWYNREPDDWRPLRIRLLDIRQERLQDISQEDVLAEIGAVEPFEAKHLWQFYEVWNAINTRAGDRWADNPLVWALTFEVVRE